MLGIEGVVAVGGGLLEDFVLSDWVCDLTGCTWRQQLKYYTTRIRQ